MCIFIPIPFKYIIDRKRPYIDIKNVETMRINYRIQYTSAVYYQNILSQHPNKSYCFVTQSQLNEASSIKCSDLPQKSNNVVVNKVSHKKIFYIEHNFPLYFY